MKLTHLVVEVCVFQPLGNEEYLASLFEKCTSLCGLELHATYLEFVCEDCVDFGGDWSLLSYFPLLKYCELHGHESNDLQVVISSCKELICLSCNSYLQLFHNPSFHFNLQQLSLASFATDLPNIFMETISAHGGLVHVVFNVNSVTVEGINSLVINSPRLLTMIIFSMEYVCNEQGSKVNSKNIISSLRKKLPGRKLFSAGDFRVVQYHRILESNLNEFAYGTDLGPLWLKK